MGRRRRDERGIALPSGIALLSIVVVAVAGVAFVATADDIDSGTDAAAPVTASAAPDPTPAAPSPTPAKKPRKKKDAVQRGEVYVEVYNNSGISGLAGSTADRIAGAGWQVVGSDNWYGTIDASTVYYPERLEDAAKLLAKDIGVARTKPAISPMRLDRLTVILTADYA